MTEQFLWVKAFEQYRMGNMAACNAVLDKYETRVNQYGYSLRNIMLTKPSKTVEPFLIYSDPA